MHLWNFIGELIYKGENPASVFFDFILGCSFEFYNVTEEVHTRCESLYQMTHAPLTGVYSQAYFFQTVQKELREHFTIPSRSRSMNLSKSSRSLTLLHNALHPRRSLHILPF